MKLTSGSFFALCFLLLLSSWVLLPQFFTRIGFVYESTLGALFALSEQDEKNRTTYNSITFVGDVMLGRNVEVLMRRNGGEYPFAFLPKISEGTALVGNFEAAIPKVHSPTPSGSFSFSVHPDFLPLLNSYGFTHMSLANNHSRDFGKEGFVRAYDELARNNITPFGDQKEHASSTIAFVKTKKGTVAVVGVYAVYGNPPKEEIKKLLTRASELSHMQIAYVHWGEEYALIHSISQETLARTLIDEGAEAVIGHHPHVVQDIALYNGKPIFYSLGNFIFDQYFNTDVQEGLIVRYTPGESEEFTLLPITSVGSHSQGKEMSSPNKEAFLQKLSERSDPALSAMIKEGIITF